ncbi:glycosyltransferase family 4 protein [Undibacterium sp. Jales W-56]|uniref:glycosyltransferase family 4 protein n=1 Tax=Undibacterium sp. Jales W-56 TaxID=2897325 RepID=UPI0021CDEE63|nr:glycosyltransferase family 4 protein [Undibacterium sp. Jales W-56]MCU6434136.1 glycosyltransferase family 4 protein [Undibacterium sp. Jales W-56]
MRLLTFSTLFPNAQRPGHGIFVETRLRHLLASGLATSRVVAPVPWFPGTHRMFGQYASFAQVPERENRFGIRVEHPRYLLPPKVGMHIAPQMLALAARPCIARMLDEGDDFDLIDAHYFYPDGVAATRLGQYFNKPVVITARGSDITLLPAYPRPRKLILQAAADASGVITVCDALKDELIRLGVSAEKIVSLRNGVDLQLFRPVDRALTRQALGLTSFTLLTVGHLVPVKGHELIIRSLPLLPEMRLLIAGDGPLRASLESLARGLNVSARVSFLGALRQDELRTYYAAADAMILASEREGWANVLLESMACGTPVVASTVWGTPEVVAAPEAGVLMAERTPASLVQAVRRLQEHYPDRAATRRYAENFSWDATTQGQLSLFRQILQRC